MVTIVLGVSVFVAISHPPFKQAAATTTSQEPPRVTSYKQRMEFVPGRGETRGDKIFNMPDKS